MIVTLPSILLIGYGNPARGDDGLGPALAEAVRERISACVGSLTVETAYQLSPEDAVTVAEHDVVIFVDAVKGDGPPFRFHRIEPRWESDFSTHSVAPETVLAFAHEVFGSTTRGYVLGIRGSSFEPFDECLTPDAAASLESALEFVTPALREGRVPAPSPESASEQLPTS